MKIIFNNALPFSGKDTLTNKIIANDPNAVHLRFKNPLYREMSKRHGLSMEQVLEICTGDRKDQPNDLLDGLVPRQVLIDISENKIKVERGETGVAQLVIDDILDTPDFNQKTFVFSDGGFESEILFLKRVLSRYGLTDLVLVRIERKAVADKDIKDSRKVIENPDIIITNDIEESGDELGNNMYAQFMTYMANR